MKQPRPTGRVMKSDEIIRAQIVFTDGTTKDVPFVSMGRKIAWFEANGVRYVVDGRGDWDDVDAIE